MRAIFKHLLSILFCVLSTYCGMFFCKFNCDKRLVDFHQLNSSICEKKSDTQLCSTNSSKEYLLNNVNQLTNLPASYDGRTKNYITSVKDQGGTNLCWAYTSIAIAEASVLAGQIDENVNKDNLSLSPTALAYSRFNRNEDPLKNNPSVYSNTDFLSATGDIAYAETLFSQWCGPIKSSLSANTNSFENCEYKLKNSINIYNSSLSKEQLILEVKKAIIKYGAVSYSYNNLHNYYYYNPKNETGSYSSPHACTLIGWDDNIAASNFKPNGAKQNGGWLVKNSYSDLPYLYLSYDNSLTTGLYAFEFEQKQNYDYNYFYDYLFDEGLNYSQNVTTAANIYKAKKSSSTQAEFIKAVNVGVVGTNITCNVQVYTNLTNFQDPTSGTLSATGSEIFDFQGYKTILLDKEIELPYNSFFSVVVSVQGQGSTVIRLATCQSESYKKTYYGWDKMSYTTARIKAFTKLKDRSLTLQDISTANVNTVADLIYTGSEICPNFKVNINGEDLILNSDYTIEFFNNVNAGKAYAELTGKNLYYGTKKVYFEIIKAEKPIVESYLIKFEPAAVYLKDIALPAGWVWQNPDRLVSDLMQEYANYVAADCINFNNTTALFTLQIQQTQPEGPGLNPEPEESAPQQKPENQQDKNKQKNFIIILTLTIVLSFSGVGLIVSGVIFKRFKK